MTKGKYIKFDQSPSNYRWIEIDISSADLLGTTRDDICPPLLRKATSKIPSVKTRFQALLE